jgi:hypothetical protein
MTIYRKSAIKQHYAPACRLRILPPMECLIRAIRVCHSPQNSQYKEMSIWKVVLEVENPLGLPDWLMSEVYKDNLNTLDRPTSDDSIVPIIDAPCDFVDTCMLEFKMDPPSSTEYLDIIDDPAILTSKFFPLCGRGFAV